MECKVEHGVVGYDAEFSNGIFCCVRWLRATQKLNVSFVTDRNIFEWIFFCYMALVQPQKLNMSVVTDRSIVEWNFCIIFLLDTTQQY